MGGNLMGFLSFIPVIGKVLDKGLDIVDDLVEDKDEANKLKAAIKQQVLVQQHDELVQALEAQSKVILAEARGGWLQRNWRPMLMLIVIGILANNYVIAPYVELFFPGRSLILELPGGLWALLNVGVGGYVASRGAEKILKKD
jgi:hypothetical protein